MAESDTTPLILIIVLNLFQLTKESKMKDRLIKELQEKIDMRERQMSKLEKENRELEQNLMLTNEKRFKLQETIGSMEKELQSTKAHVNQLADINTRYEVGMRYSNNYKSPHQRPIRSPYSIQCDQNELDQNYGTIRDAATNVKFSNTTIHRHACSAQVPNDQLSDFKNINSKSLISLSLRQIDFLKSRLSYLTKLTPLKSEESVVVAHQKASKHSLPREYGSRSKLNKMVELTAKRYHHLQKQAYESYEELTNLMKLAASNNKLNENVQ